MPREFIPTRTLGIDLASQAKDTGVCLIEWTGDGGRVIDLEDAPLTDDHLVDLILGESVSKVGIDAPFGWPVAFIDAIQTYGDQGRWLDLDPNVIRFRATELHVWEETRRAPLSVSMDNLAWPAMRCARLFSRLAGEHGVLDRSGRGLYAEVYPMAALRRWGVIAPETPVTDWTYKGHEPGRRETRQKHLAGLLELLDGSVEMSEAFAERCVSDDDDLDAFISALVAQATSRSLTDPIPRDRQWLALREGWIHLPLAGSLGQLAVN